MPVVGTLLTSGQVNAASGFTTASVTPTAGALQILTINATRGSSTNPTAPTSLTGNGLTWVLIANLLYDTAGVGRSVAWVYRAMAAAPTAGSLVVSGMGTNVDTGIVYQWCQFTGVKQTGTHGSGAVRQVFTGSITTSDTPSATLFAFGAADNATFGYAAGRGAGANTLNTAGAGFTLLNTRYQGSSQSLYASVEWKSTNDTTVDFGFTFVGGGGGGGVVTGIEIVAAPSQQLPATLSVDVDMSVAFSAVTPGGTLGPTTFAPDVEVAVVLSTRRPNYQRPRREILWVSGYTGEQICAIT